MIAIIPARGGSKGLPKKNIKLLGGKPLIQWTIEAAKNSSYISKIVLSTDDEEIANICKPLDIEIPFMRPPELAQDNSLAINAYTYTIDRLSKEFNQLEDEFVVLLPTSPLRNSSDIDEAINIFYDNNADSVISCNVNEHPTSWLFDIDKNGKINKNQIESNEMMNRQNYREKFIPNGAIYVLKNSLLKKYNTYYFENSYAYIMPKERSIDIDTEFDFKLANYLIKDK